MDRLTDRQRAKRDVRSDIRQALKPFGYAPAKDYFIIDRNDMVLGVWLYFLPIRESVDLLQAVPEVFAYSEAVTDVLEWHSGMGWQAPLVSVCLWELVTGVGNRCWDIRLDEPSSLQMNIDDMKTVLVKTGLPFLDKIQTDFDIVRIMRDTRFTKFAPARRKELVAKYIARVPEFS